MSKVYLIHLTTVIPVVGASEEDAMDLLIANPEYAAKEAVQALEAYEEDMEHRHTMEAEVVAVSDVERDGYWLDVVPWGDDSDETIGERLGLVDHDEDEVDNGSWMEPNQED